MITKYLLLPLIAIMMVVGLATTASAATRTWNGNGDTTTWSDELNWNTTAPTSGDNILINTSCCGWPIGTKTVENDIYGLSLAGIEIQTNCLYRNHAIRITGNPISISGDINVRCTTFFMDGGLIFLNSVNFNDLETLSSYSNYANMALGSVNLGAYRLGLVNGAHVSFDGVVSAESSAKVVARGAERRVADVFLWANARIDAPLYLQYQSQLRGSGRAGKVVIEKSAFLVPGGGETDCMRTGNLTLRGFLHIYVEGLATCDGHSRVNVTGRVDISGARLNHVGVDSGSGFTRGKRVVIIANDGKDKVIGKFLGLSEGETFEYQERSFKITYKGGTGNDVVLTRQ